MKPTETTNIYDVLRDGKIIVPDYQRAYSWETAKKNDPPLHTNVFLSDIESFLDREAGEYYFGHFLFEQTSNEGVYAVIDGQQRLTTITIFLALAFRWLGELNEDEKIMKEDLVKRSSRYRFETVKYDRIFFNEYVIDGTRANRDDVQFVSQRRLADAADLFNDYFSTKSRREILKLINVVVKAKCTTHMVHDVSNAVQMFLFQNNRGKKPTKLEIVKALLMRTAYLQGGGDKDEIIREISEQFSRIYQNISSIEEYVGEDDVLACAMRIHCTSLYMTGSVEEVEAELNKDGITFVWQFVKVLADCFRYADRFFKHDADRYVEAQALRVIGCGAWALPIVVRCYDLAIPQEGLQRVWTILTSLLVRQRIIGTRAMLVSRLNDIFRQLTNDKAVSDLEKRFKTLRRSSDYWWSYWNDTQLETCLKREIRDRALSKFLLWEYENYLIRHGSEGGYSWKRYDEIVSPELEHIAPQTPTNGDPVAHGYGKYDDSEEPEQGIVSGHLMDSIGNHLILPKSHNCQIGNHEFFNGVNGKCDTYTHSEQQIQVGEIAKERKKEVGDVIWDSYCIRKRQDMIVDALMKVFSLDDISSDKI